jgi:hypothetical protein
MTQKHTLQLNTPKPVPIPRPLRTRDLILNVLEQHFESLSTREILSNLRRLGPYQNQSDGHATRDLRANLDELLRLGHITRHDTTDTGPRWRRVPNHIVPKHRLSAIATRLREFALVRLAEVGPQTAEQLSEAAIGDGITPDDKLRAAQLGSILAALVKAGDLLASPVRVGSRPCLQYRLPGQNPVPVTRPKAAPRLTEPSRLQQAILRRLKTRPSTALDLTPALIKAKHIKPGDYASRAVGSACMGLVRRGLVSVTKQGKDSVYYQKSDSHEH